MKTRKELLAIKNLAKNGKIIAAIITILGALGFGMFSSIENEAEKGLMILDQGRLDQVRLK